MTSLPEKIELAPLQTDSNDVCGRGARVTLDSIVQAYLRGETPEEIAERFPAVSLADIYGTIAYYLRDQVDVYLAEQTAKAERIRRKIGRVFSPPLACARRSGRLGNNLLLSC